MSRKKDDVWVSPRKSGWAVKREGAERADSVHDKKSDAVDRARDLAKRDGVELLVQDQEGKIQMRNTYPRQRDKFPPRG